MEQYPLFTYCARVVSLANNPKFKVYTSPLCLAIAFYFTEKKNGTELARKKTGLLSSKLKIITIDEDTVAKTNNDKAIHDFEDGMQYYSALNAKCKCIITEDKSNFYFSKVEVLNAEDFLLKYALKKLSLSVFQLPIG